MVMPMQMADIPDAETIGAISAAALGARDLLRGSSHWTDMTAMQTPRTGALTNSIGYKTVMKKKPSVGVRMSPERTPMQFQASCPSEY